MAELRTHEGASCLLSPHPQFPGVVWLSRLTTQPESRRKGHAKALLLQIVQDADAAGLDLMLEPKPFGDCPLDEVDLELFYNRFGFTRELADGTTLHQENGDPLMVRIAR